MKANELLDMIGNADDGIIEETINVKRHIIQKWTKYAAAAACLCIAAYAAVNTLSRFDYLKAGCANVPGTIVGDDYYYNVRHSGVWKYSNGSREKVLSTYFEDDWKVNETGLYYKSGTTLYRMNLSTLERHKLYSASDCRNISFELADGESIILTCYSDMHEVSQLLINGRTGEVIETLTEKSDIMTGFDQLYTDRHYQVGERSIELTEVGDRRYMPTESGIPLLPEDKYVEGGGRVICDGVMFFYVYDAGDERAKPDYLIIFADGHNVIIPNEQVPCEHIYSGAIGHILLYADTESSSGIWCFDTDSDEKWQLGTDKECSFYDFVNDETKLYACQPWNNEQTVWSIVYEGDRPVSLQQIDKSIIY